MNIALDISRRKFLVGSASAAGGLALGFHVPFGSAAEAAEAPGGQCLGRCEAG